MFISKLIPLGYMFLLQILVIQYVLNADLQVLKRDKIVKKSITITGNSSWKNILKEILNFGLFFILDTNILVSIYLFVS